MTKRTVGTVLAATLLLSGCVPGGLFMPAPIGHTDRPAVSGRVQAGGEPIEGMQIAVAVNGDACDEPDATRATAADGSFRFDEDFSYYTLFWGEWLFELSICIRPDEQPTAATFTFDKAERSSIVLDCEMRADKTIDCIRFAGTY